MGAQTKLGDKLYFDVNVGMGWSNVNVDELSNTLYPNYTKNTGINSPFYLLYEEGKGQRFYMPLAVSLGYNFGAR
jgi:hypothetical protein